MSHNDHFVQFYEQDSYLLTAVSQYLFHGLKTGEPVGMIATESNRESIATLIRSFGIDPAVEEADGRFVILDAQETLDRFMVDGLPDRDLFEATLGKLAHDLSKRSPSFRLFGEMVAVLNASGNRAGAIRLEEMWHDLNERYTFSLFCAYPIDGFAGPNSTADFAAICDHHSKVIPAESYNHDSNDERCRIIAKLQQRVVELESELATMKGGAVVVPSAPGA